MRFIRLCKKIKEETYIPEGTLCLCNRTAIASAEDLKQETVLHADILYYNLRQSHVTQLIVQKLVAGWFVQELYTLCTGFHTDLILYYY